MFIAWRTDLTPAHLEAVHENAFLPSGGQRARPCERELALRPFRTGPFVMMTSISNVTFPARRWHGLIIWADLR